MEIPSKGIPYLNRSLREQFMNDQSKKPINSQQFVALPQTSIPADLQLRGPQALSAEEVNFLISMLKS